MPTAAAHDTVSIKRWPETTGRERLVSAIDHIFFEAALKKTFASPAERNAFRERWLGRYLEHDPSWAYLALDGETVVGYLVGSAEDPAKTARFKDIAVPDFAEWTAAYPAHLHVNLAPDYRNHGLGGRLIDAFVADLARQGVPGVHVVTGMSSRNVAFYRRHALHELARGRLAGHDVVLLGRRLSDKDIPVQETS
jgi:GNAT superfamily N-acetyltransferase